MSNSLFRLVLPTVFLVIQGISCLRAEDEPAEQSPQTESSSVPSESTDLIASMDQASIGSGGKEERTLADKEEDLTAAEREQYKADKAKIHNAPELIQARKAVKQTTGDKSAAIEAKWETKESLILKVDPSASTILEKKEEERREKSGKK